MNLDELAEHIGALSPDPGVQRLTALLRDWKTDDATVAALAARVERHLATAGIAQGHAEIERLWESFREKAIAGIGGMTMNERLYWFSLFERKDAAEGEAERLAIYRKLHAKP